MNDLGRVRAPELPPDGPWLNCEDPAAWLSDLRGQVVVADFWAHCCIHCMHMLPVLSRLEERFSLAPVQVLGVHTPKFVQEQGLESVRNAVQRYHVQHPVLLDARQELWSKFAVKAWPTLVLIDSEGYVREHLPGETSLEDLAERVEELLAEGRTNGTLRENPIDPASDASADEHTLFFPGKVCADDSRLFIADSGHHRILVCDHQGRVEKILGDGTPGDADGRFDVCRFRDPQGMARRGNYLYVADRGNHRLRRVDLDLFWVETLAGSGRLGDSAESADPGAPLENALRSPWDLVAVGNHLVIAMAGSHQLWLYDIEKNDIGAWAGSGIEDHIDDSLQAAAFAQPSGLCLAGSFLMVADSEVSSVRAVSLEEGVVQTVVGHGLFEYGDVDGEGHDVLLQHCMDVARIGETLYVADTFNHKIKAIDLRTRRCHTMFGAGDTRAFNEPAGMTAVDGRLLVADTNHHRLVWADPVAESVTPLELEFSTELA
jgi:thiol-disulfide isomerase/thioredoxin